MIFHTCTGSIYELDEQNKQARRLHGSGDGTARANADWRAFVDYYVEVGKPAMICWGANTPLLVGSYGGMPATMTSVVTKIEDKNAHS